jgi:hypothetical protein
MKDSRRTTLRTRAYRGTSCPSGLTRTGDNDVPWYGFPEAVA